MDSRIRAIRKATGLTMEAFGAKIGVSKSVIANLEYGRVEPSDLIKKAIVREHGVTLEYLENGEEPMFFRDTGLKAMVSAMMAGENETARAVFMALADLDAKSWEAVKNFITDVARRLDG